MWNSVHENSGLNCSLTLMKSQLFLMSLCTDAVLKSISSNSEKLHLKDSFLQDLFNCMAKILLECIKKKRLPVNFPDGIHHTNVFILYDRNSPLSQSSRGAASRQPVILRGEAAHLLQREAASPLRAAHLAPLTTQGTKKYQYPLGTAQMEAAMTYTFNQTNTMSSNKSLNERTQSTSPADHNLSFH